MDDQPESVGDVANLYLGNILFALELAAINMDEHQKPADAAFYRGIARKLAEAKGPEVPGGGWRYTRGDLERAIATSSQSTSERHPNSFPINGSDFIEFLVGKWTM